MNDGGLERLLGYDRRRYWLSNGWSLRIRVWRTTLTASWPQGLRYALTLHDVDGSRILGFDNAHGTARRHQPFDHEHRVGRLADPVPYDFTDPDMLLADFFKAARRACIGMGSDLVIVDEDMIGPTNEEDTDANA